MHVNTKCPNCGEENVTTFEMWEAAQNIPKVIKCGDCKGFYAVVGYLSIAADTFTLHKTT